MKHRVAASLIALTSLVSNEVLAQETPSPVITKAPELLEFVEPAYPVELTDVAGEVVLMIEIDAAGAVVAADVIRSSDARFEAPAIDAARRFEFSPAEIDGEPASVRIEYAIQFQPSVDESLVEPDSSAPDVVPEEPPVVIEGRILEAGNRRPVTGAEIVVDETMFTESRDGGHFEIRGAPVGSLRVRVSHPSFTAFEVMENRLESEKLVVTYYLRRDSNDPFETVVRSKTPRREVARVQLSRAEVSRVPGTFGDPIRVIENLPGLARAPGGVGGALIVRGANPDDTGVYVDGVEIPILYHFGGLTSVIPPDVLENIQFYPSGFSAKYSRATAGIVDVTTRDLDCETLRLNVEIDFIDSAAYACVPLGDWHVAAAVRRSYVDLYLPLILDAVFSDEDDGRVTASPIYTDYQLKAQTTWGDHRLTLFTFGSSDDLEFIRSGSAEDVNTDTSISEYFNRMVAQDRWNLSDKLELHSSVSLGYTEFASSERSEDTGTDNELDAPLYELDWREELRWAPLDSLAIRVGLDHKFLMARLRSRLPADDDLRIYPAVVVDDRDTQELARNPREATQGYWGEVQWSPLPGLTLIPGLRVDRFNFEDAEALVFLPRLSARWEVFSGTTLKAFYGRFARLPEPQFLLEAPFGQPRLGPERSTQIVAGLEQRIGDEFFVDVQAYTIDRDELRQPSDEVDFVEGQAVTRIFDNGGEGETRGLDLLVRKEASTDSLWYGWVAYTLSRTTRRDTFGRSSSGAQGVVDDDRELDGVLDQSATVSEYRSFFDQPHILTVVAQFRLPRNWELGARFRLVSGNPFTPLNRNESYLDTDFGSYLADTNGVEFNSGRVSAFHQLDLRLDRTWVFDRWTLTAYLEVINAYNRSNVETVDYDFRFREQAGASFLPILPVLGVRGAF